MPDREPIWHLKLVGLMLRGFETIGLWNWRDGRWRPAPEHSCWPGGAVRYMSDDEMRQRGLEPRRTPA